jgi:hypothetical protein
VNEISVSWFPPMEADLWLWVLGEDEGSTLAMQLSVVEIENPIKNRVLQGRNLKP